MKKRRRPKNQYQQMSRLQVYQLFRASGKSVFSAWIVDSDYAVIERNRSEFIMLHRALCDEYMWVFSPASIHILITEIAKLIRKHGDDICEDSWRETMTALQQVPRMESHLLGHNPSVGYGLGIEHGKYDQWPALEYRVLDQWGITCKLGSMEQIELVRRANQRKKKPYGVLSEVWKLYRAKGQAKSVQQKKERKHVA
jgi:hypothetical protein